jgi:hypothetical protein
MGTNAGHRWPQLLTLLTGVAALLTLTSCQDGHWADVLQAQVPGHAVQEGTVLVRDGEPARVVYKTPFQGTPRVLLLGFESSYFKDTPYHLSDFQVVRQGADFFLIESQHREQHLGAWAVLKWRAEGVRAVPRPLAECRTREQLVLAVETLGGKVTLDVKAPDKPILALDLHGTRVTDADLAAVAGLTTLRLLNLYGTGIGDLGVASLSRLPNLQALHLNGTAVSDAGLVNLQRLVQLRDLGLANTRITDAGLANLRGLANLQHLTISGTAVTDRGLEQLKGLAELRQLFVSHTRVTESGIQELKRSLPRLRIFQ